MTVWTRKHFFILFTLVLLFSAIVDFAWSFVPLYFLQNGFSLIQLFGYEALFYLFPIIVLPFFKRVNIRTAIIFSLCIQMVCLGVLASGLSVGWKFLIAGALRGSALGFFWASIQTGYYEFAHSHKRAFHSALLTMIGPLMDMVLPAVSGLFIQQHSITLSLIIAEVITGVALLCTFALPSHTIETPRQTYSKSVKGVRAFFTLEGGIRTATISVIPLLSLQYFTRPEQLGFFLSYLGILGAISSLLVARFSDKLNRRRVFLRPITVIVCASLFAALLSDNSVSWVITTGCFAFFMQILMPLSSAAAFDRHPETETLWFSREFYYNIGRFSMVLWGIAMVWLKLPFMALLGPLIMGIGYFFNLKRLQKKMLVL